MRSLICGCDPTDLSTDCAKPPCIYTCGACGCRSSKVEAAGMHCCPNPLCTGRGAGWARHTLDSCASKGEGDSHSVDILEYVSRYLREPLDMGGPITQARDRSALRYITEYNLDSPDLQRWVAELADADKRSKP